MHSELELKNLPLPLGATPIGGQSVEIEMTLQASPNGLVNKTNRTRIGIPVTIGEVKRSANLLYHENTLIDCTLDSISRLNYADRKFWWHATLGDWLECVDLNVDLFSNQELATLFVDYVRKTNKFTSRIPVVLPNLDDGETLVIGTLDIYSLEACAKTGGARIRMSKIGDAIFSRWRTHHEAENNIYHLELRGFAYEETIENELRTIVDINNPPYFVLRYK